MKLFSLASILIPNAYALTQSAERSNSLFTMTIQSHDRHSNNEDVDTGRRCTVADTIHSNGKITWTCKADIGYTNVTAVGQTYTDMIGTAVNGSVKVGSAALSDATSAMEFEPDFISQVWGDPDDPSKRGDGETQIVIDDIAADMTAGEPGESYAWSGNHVIADEDECTFVVTCEITTSASGHTYSIDDDGGCASVSSYDNVDAARPRIKVGATRATTLDDFAHWCKWSASVTYKKIQADLYWTGDATDTTFGAALPNSGETAILGSVKIDYDYPGHEMEDLLNDGVSESDNVSGELEEQQSLNFNNGGDDSHTFAAFTQEFDMDVSASIDLLASNWHSNDFVPVITKVAVDQLYVRSTANSGTDYVAITTQDNGRGLLQDGSVHPKLLSDNNKYVANGVAACSHGATGVFFPETLDGSPGCVQMNPAWQLTIGSGSARQATGSPSKYTVGAELGTYLDDCRSGLELHIAHAKYEVKDHGYEITSYMRHNCNEDDIFPATVSVQYSETILADLNFRNQVLPDHSNNTTDMDDSTDVL